MSASSKKKLRNEQAADKMTQRQLQEQQDAKKLKRTTAAFCAVIIALAVLAVSVLAYRGVTNSGIRERNTVAATIGNHKISNAELNYFYIDAIDYFYSQYGSYLMYMGLTLDTTLPLDQQMYDAAAGITWADYFLDGALNNAASIYAMADAANAAGFTLTEDQLAAIDQEILTQEVYAQIYGYSNLNSYLKAKYGNGANEKTYREYLELTDLAENYYNYYGQSLTYTDAQLRAAEADKMSDYSNYSFNYYYVDVDAYLPVKEETAEETSEDTTEDTTESGESTEETAAPTYTDDEIASAQAAALADAELLTGADIVTVEDFNMAVMQLATNPDKTLPSEADNIGSGSILALMKDWVIDASRVNGDKTFLAHETKVTNEDGTETTTLEGYYVIFFIGMNDNTYILKDVRHVLIPYEGGVYNSSTDTTDYTEAEKAAAETEAQALLDQWLAGDKSEESFAQLANTNSADSDGTDGGLYTNVYRNQMVPSFDAWVYDETRQSGDTGLVHSTYGVHIMYFVGDSTMTYRDFMISEDLRSADLQSWYTQQVSAMTITKGNTKYINTSLVLG